MRDMVWTCRDGRQLLVAEMSDEHLTNCIAMIIRTGWRAHFLDRLLLELDIRRLGLRR